MLILQASAHWAVLQCYQCLFVFGSLYPEAERYFVCPQCSFDEETSRPLCLTSGLIWMSGWELWAEIHVMLAHMRCDAADAHACVGLRIASRWMGGCAAELKMKDTWDPPPPPHHISVRSLMWTGLRLRKRGGASLPD